MAKRALILILVAGALWAAAAWPRINDVETGRTPEYPDLRVREYGASVETVSRAARSLVSQLPRWSFVAAGTGPRGAEIQASHLTFFRLEDHVTIRIWSEGSKTRVSVRSRSKIGTWDFGQNARNIREFLGALDGRMS